jgi:hypothetical protein
MTTRRSKIFNNGLSRRSVISLPPRTVTTVGWEYAGRTRTCNSPASAPMRSRNAARCVDVAPTARGSRRWPVWCAHSAGFSRFLRHFPEHEFLHLARRGLGQFGEHHVARTFEAGHALAAPGDDHADVRPAGWIRLDFPPGGKIRIRIGLRRIAVAVHGDRKRPAQFKSGGSGHRREWHVLVNLNVGIDKPLQHLSKALIGHTLTPNSYNSRLQVCRLHPNMRRGRQFLEALKESRAARLRWKLQYHQRSPGNM